MERCLIYFDHLGGNISLHYKNRTSHRNWVGGLLTLLIGAFSIALSIYFGLDIFFRKDPKANLINKFTDNAGKKNFSRSGIAHYFFIQSLKNISQLNFDPRAVNITGTIMTGKTGKVLGSYLYDTCDLHSDFEGIEYLFVEQLKAEIKKAVCPRVYINAEGKQFNKDDPGYMDPYIEFGMSTFTKIPTYYVFSIKKCSNSDKCYPLHQINDYYANTVYSLKFVDNYFDVNNYTNPASKFINSITGLLGPEIISANYLNFLSVNFTTQDGLLFDNFNVEESYIFDYRVESIVNTTPDNKEILNVSFFLQNMSQFYYRSYTKLQDVFADIGGIVQFLTLFGFYINFFFDKFQKIYDWSIFFDQMIKYPSKIELMKKSTNENPKNETQVNTAIRTDFSERAIAKNYNLYKLSKLKEPLNFFKLYCDKSYQKQHHIEEIKKCVEIMLDESNLFKMYFEIIKIKKIILGDKKKKHCYESLDVTFQDIFKLNFHEDSR